jgi:hypothetical protein
MVALVVALGCGIWCMRVQGEVEGSITEITLEHSECFGACPVYKLTLQADGTATYKGKEFVERIGTYSARLAPSTFRRLAETSEALKYFKLKDRYKSNWSDGQHVITSVVRGGKRKTVDDDRDTGPTPLWAFERVVEAEAAKLNGWQRVP